MGIVSRIWYDFRRLQSVPYLNRHHRLQCNCEIAIERQTGQLCAVADTVFNTPCGVGRVAIGSVQSGGDERMGATDASIEKRDVGWIIDCFEGRQAL